MRKWLLRIGGGLVALLILAVVWFVWWGSTPLGPSDEALAAIKSTDTVIVTENEWLVFSPSNENPTTGFIFYPGGRVDYRSYAPFARDIANEGYLVIITPMPLSLAVFGINEADGVITAYPDIPVWVIGGHSLGGAMASSYTYNHQDLIDGLVLWASYPPKSNSLSSYGGEVISIYGSVENIKTGGGIEASKELLPDDTLFVEIEGGNHAGFGWYGPQPGDAVATISKNDQQRQVVEATVAFLAALTR